MLDRNGENIAKKTVFKTLSPRKTKEKNLEMSKYPEIFINFTYYDNSQIVFLNICAFS